jgi:hypothetical protein
MTVYTVMETERPTVGEEERRGGGFDNTLWLLRHCAMQMASFKFVTVQRTTGPGIPARSAALGPGLGIGLRPRPCLAATVTTYTVLC